MPPRAVVTTQNNHVTRQQINSFVATGAEIPGNNARSYVILEDPRYSITKSDARQHSVSRIGWGQGSYPSNYRVSVVSWDRTVQSDHKKRCRFFEGHFSTVLGRRSSTLNSGGTTRSPNCRMTTFCGRVRFSVMKSSGTGRTIGGVTRCMTG